MLLERVKFWRQTLKQFGRSVGRTATEGVELVAGHELVAEAKVCYLDVHVTVQQKVLRLATNNMLHMRHNHTCGAMLVTKITQKNVV